MRGARLHFRAPAGRIISAPARSAAFPLPKGLRESDALPEPIFTPATKAQTGHDENISFETAASLIGADLAARLRDLTLSIYKRAADYARSRGIIIADTKFEFGMIDGEIMLADEVLTPDSSRFWPLESYSPGGAQPSYDKQYVRDYLESIHWNKQPPAPALPEDVARRTSEKYKEAYRALTGKSAVNLLDILLVIIVAASVVTGFMAGFARVGIGFIAAISGDLFGFWFYGIPAEWFHSTSNRETLSNLLGFFVVYFRIHVRRRADRQTAFEAVQVDRPFLAGSVDGRRCSAWCAAA